MDKIVIIGAGGHGRVVLDILRAAERYDPIGFIDANHALHGCMVDGLKVLGDLSVLEPLKLQGVTRVIVAIGDNQVRQQYAQAVNDLELELITAIHPSANVAASAHIGNNVVIAAGALVCAHSVIGDSVILNTGCIVDHESIIACASHICPGAKLAGRVTVDCGAFVGIGATIIQNVRIGTDAVVGAGAVVIRDAPPGATVVGIPARTLRTLKKQVVRFPPTYLDVSLQEAAL